MKGIRVYADIEANDIYICSGKQKPNATLFSDSELAERDQRIWDAAREQVLSEDQQAEVVFHNLRFEDKYETLADYEKQKAEFLERKK